MKTEFLRKLRKKDIYIDHMQDRAYDVLNEFDMRKVSKGGVRIIAILNGFGIKTYMDELTPRELSAYIAIDPRLQEKFGTNRIACVNSRDSDGHKRFALAHELAHYLFDYDEYEELTYYNTYVANDNDSEDEREIRANRFAASILMPTDCFMEYYKENEKNYSKPDLVNEIGLYFRVSPKAVLRRFKEMEISGFE